MTTRTRLRSLGACALLLLASAGVLAPPASAAAPSLLISRPGDAQVLGVSNFAVDAEARMNNGVLVGKIRVTVVPLDEGSKQAPQSGEYSANEREVQSVSFPAQVEYNGQYRATVTATGSDRPLDLDGPETAGPVRRDFFVAAPPAPPSDVKAVVDKESRAVTLSWSANTEKDLLFYLVQRAKGDGAFSPLAKTAGPGDTSIIDPSTAEAAGEYRYQVVAVRAGAKPDQGVNSDPSPAATASVAGSGAPVSTVPGGATASTTPGASGPGTTLAPNSPGALKKSGTLDLSGFSSIQNQARRPAVRRADPDPGFTEALPFGATDTTRLVGDEQASAPPAGDDAEVRELGAEDASNDRQRSAAFLAGGLLATVLLMHLLWIKGEVQREPLEALAPEEVA